MPGLPYQHAPPFGWGLTRTTVALREGLQARVSCSGRPQPGHRLLTSQPSRHPSLKFNSLPAFNSILKKFDPCSYSARRGCAAVLPHLKELLCTECRSKSSAVPMNTWFSISCSSQPLNFHKHPPLTRKSCLTTKLRGITCRPLSSTAVSP